MMIRNTIASVLALAAAPSLAAVNLVQNGGFEQLNADATGSRPASFEVGPNWIYGQAVTGWTSAAGGTANANQAFNILFDGATAFAGQGGVEPSTRYSASETQLLSAGPGRGPSPDGGNFMAMDSDVNFNGAFSQTITGLTSGRDYLVKFYFAGTQFQNRGGDTTTWFNVSLGNQTQQTPVFGGPTHYFQGWTAQTMRFTAQSNTQVLSFLAQGTPNGLPPVSLLDGVSMSAVPEPATWAMMILGFGLVGAAARRRAAVLA